MCIGPKYSQQVKQNNNYLIHVHVFTETEENHFSSLTNIKSKLEVLCHGEQNIK